MLHQIFLPAASAAAVDFARDVRPILERNCYACHGPEKQKSGYRLDVRDIALRGGDSGDVAIVPQNAKKSPLVRFVSGEDAETVMPPKKSDKPRLTAEEVSTLRAWVNEGPSWPDEFAGAKDTKPHWSLTPLVKPAVPGGAANPIDAFISAKLGAKGLAISPEADPRTLIRRLYFDLTGLPPSPEEVEEFAGSYGTNRTDGTHQSHESHPSYRALVDRLLASPRYGERWARHWLDVVHYGETHGYDKDQPRPNAWPYRDYVIRAFNEDKPYARFVQEQIAGDALFPGTRDGIEALGFISAGPWDLLGHMEVSEDKIDGKVARHLDRDDMVANTINTFCSMTVHCAQCHDHKFDPISAEDYYSLQSVFAALDRADRPYDLDPERSKKRTALTAQKRQATMRVAELRKQAAEGAGEALTSLEKKIAEVKKGYGGEMKARVGWHSAISQKQDTAKWVQVDLGKSTALSQVVLHPCSDDFNGIGDGFGFPVRFKVEASDDATFASGVTLLADETAKDFENPKIRAVSHGASGSARYVRITATKLAPRRDDFIFTLAELEVFDTTGKNLAAKAPVTSLDSTEAAPRWTRANLTDGWFPGADVAKIAVASADTTKLEQARRLILESMLGEKATAELDTLEREAVAAGKELAALPAPRVIYAGTIHTGGGTFKGTGASGGKPRPITVLARGDVKRPGATVKPGAISGVTALPARFDVPETAAEDERRAALARWITDPKNPLTWRSIVNRVWQYHFGRGLVDTPNDFGRMGGTPSHPELLEWLAATFRDDMGGSMKQLHKLIVMSATWRQSSVAALVKARADQPGEGSASKDESARTFTSAAAIDPDNTLLWRQNRRKLEAEALRDSVLAVAGKLDLKMGGPSFKDFVVTHPEHSPHYEYHLADAENREIHRRSIYRFLVRSQQQPWMAAFDCADPSMLVDKRNQTITPLQALAQLNNQLMVVMAKHFAARVDKMETMDAKIAEAFQLALQRPPTAEENKTLTAYAGKHGLANTCRLILNLNEFAFAD